MRRFATVFALCSILSFTLPSIAAACGALIPADDQIRQAGLNVIFAVDGQANQTTAYIQINYVGDPAEFAWILPVPNNPKVDVIEASTFAELHSLTDPRVTFPSPPECFPAITGAAPEGAGQAPDVLQQGQVGPYDYSVIEDRDPAALETWLKTNGYQTPAGLEAALKPYTEAGMPLIAMKLKAGADTKDIQPVAISFTGTTPMLPLRLAALSSEPKTPITVWIFGAAQAIPTNTERFTMRENDLALTAFDGSNNYKELRSGVLASVAGKGFLTEYAQQSKFLNPQDSLLKELTNKYAFLTRLYAEISPEEMLFDPAFGYSPDLPPLSNNIDLTYRAEPYDCETATLHTVRRQQYDAAKGNRSSEEEATANLRRGPLRIGTLLVIGVTMGSIWLLARRPKRRPSA
ncbi:DUF2330 domain-containing protein [Herpetosiphon gulosus]|uniref:DUF2330 domain-containing protein n=1 Tax=Herpetosiphon gulosus TaxID=1973496 RepID=A0ABP9X4M6_9CHLR